MHCSRRLSSSSSSSSSVKLLVPSPPDSSSTTTTTAVTGVGGGNLVCFHLGEGWEEKGVNLGAVGWALGLDPASVRLNGYLLGARGPDHVAPSVTWRSLLAFFTARGLPTGRGGCEGPGGSVAGDRVADDPIIVQGRPASPASLSCGQKFSGFCFHHDHTNRCYQEGGWRTDAKRKLAFRHESPPGEGKLKPDQCGWSAPEDGEDGVGDSVLCIAKKLRLDDEGPIEKRKKTERDPGPAKLSACSTPAGAALNCVMGHRKRRREDELVATLPRKRIA